MCTIAWFLYPLSMCWHTMIWCTLKQCVRFHVQCASYNWFGVPYKFITTKTSKLTSQINCIQFHCNIIRKWIFGNLIFNLIYISWYKIALYIIHLSCFFNFRYFLIQTVKRTVKFSDTDSKTLLYHPCNPTLFA